MAHAVFTHADGSVYDDKPEERYHFPQTYLRQVEAALGDWIVYYEPRRIEAGSDRTGGRQAYFATARVVRIDRDFRAEGFFYARVADYIAFPAPVPFRDADSYFESLLKRPDGQTSKGAFGRAVRGIPPGEFDAILSAGFAGVRDELGPQDWIAEQDEPAMGFNDPVVPFRRRIVERLAQRPFREAAFARQVKAAYGARCAMTGLRILNGGGRPEVQAAHIRPVAEGGPDAVRNGLALSGTVHWMFDRHLVAVDADGATILVADGHIPEAARRLILPDRRLLAPTTVGLKPHPDYLAHHRAQFKG